MTPLESVPCALCGADTTLLLFHGWDRLHGGPGRFATVQCQGCGLIYLNPRPPRTEMEGYYPTDYPPHAQAIEATKERLNPCTSLFMSRWGARYGIRAIRYHGLSKQLRAVVALQPPGDLLDVGCGSGAFLAYARDHGWKVRGVELVEAAASFCRDVLNLPVVTGDLLEASFPSQSFDVVTLWSVLEHVHNPMAVLHEIRRILRPGGLLVLAIPNLDSVDAHLFGPAWVGYDVPRHLYLFSHTVIQRMLAQCGFGMVCRRCLFGGRTFFLSAQLYLGQQPNRPLWKRASLWVRRLENSPLVQMLTALYFHLIDALGAGPILTVFARPDAGVPVLHPDRARSQK